jgi:hypothetical protein
MTSTTLDVTPFAVKSLDDVYAVLKKKCDELDNLGAPLTEWVAALGYDQILTPPFVVLTRHDLDKVTLGDLRSPFHSAI